jgi:hypothetical protein
MYRYHCIYTVQLGSDTVFYHPYRTDAVYGIRTAYKPYGTSFNFLVFLRLAVRCSNYGRVYHTVYTSGYTGFKKQVLIYRKS